MEVKVFPYLPFLYIPQLTFNCLQLPSVSPEVFHQQGHFS